jgi:hypothetical protein
MHLFDGILGFVLRRHYDEPKPLRFTLACVSYNGNRRDLAETLKSLTQVVFGCLA